jgi:ribulose 1,5-bisphosphate synthetase/thiazole synthase
MTGPEHYTEAEHLLASLGNRTGDREDENNTVALAQVHAMLALVAATADSGARQMNGVAFEAWHEVSRESR